MAITKKTTKSVKADKKVIVEKKAPAKKAVAKKTAVKTEKKASVSKCASGALTRIVAKVDAGWGNQLYIRGCGGDLSWDRGVPMQCINDDEWLWEKKCTDPEVCFKILINDNVWCVGDDSIVPTGETIVFTPCFLM